MAIGNLRALANSRTTTVNPNTVATLKRSSGAVSLPGGIRVPEYFDSQVAVQVQALSFGDLQQIDGLNIQGVRRALYINGAVAGVIRAAQKGGDIIVFAPGTLPEGDTWLIVHVLEPWSQWSKFVITLQIGG